LALDGEDLRGPPLSMRKANLARLLARRPDGIFVAPFEQGEIGLDLFRAAWARRAGVETPRLSCPFVWHVEALVEGDEPQAAGDEPGDGLALICRA
jgi:hypothetical protein